MSIEIDVLNGDASWPVAKPLFNAVWPPDVIEKLPWAGIVFAHAELRVLVQAEPEGLVCHVGIYRREVKWNGRKIRAGGIGGVLTREDARRRGYASIALNAAIQTLKDEGSTDFALLFCEPHNAPFYVGRGWKPTARSMSNSPRGAFASTPSRPTSTTSGGRRGKASSTCAACRGDHLQRHYNIAPI
jgi:aminoglycoside 2'-N-acetyltransferase I